MKKAIIFVILIIVIIILALIFDQDKFMKKKSEEKIPRQDSGQVRAAVVAGTFYSGDEKELSKIIDEFLDNVELPKIEGNIRAIIVPHAGYVYSGQVAAYGYKAIQNNPPAGRISRIILIGNSHQEYFDGASIYPKGYFETPLGKVEIDADFAQKLMDYSDKIYFKESAHLAEHSLEVQLPFLQRTLNNFKIVPIILGNQVGIVDVLINALKSLIDDNTLVIASSDLSHYPSYKDAQYSDNKVIQAILTGEKENLNKTIADLEKQDIPNLQTCACAQDAIEAVMGLFRDKNIQLLKSANSGDVTGDKSQVVGYAAIVFTSDLPTGEEGISENELNKEQQKRLLEIAQQSVETYIKERKVIKVEENSPTLNKSLGAFVTLKKNEELRGCIGTFEPDKPLYQIVIEMAISAAVNDPRFNPVTESELNDLEYEVSVLSPLKKVDSYEDVEIGKHGVEIIQGLRKGVFLPQVATENNWDRETFLSVLCTQKAGLPTDCYKDKDTEIYVFTAQVFKED